MQTHQQNFSCYNPTLKLILQYKINFVRISQRDYAARADYLNDTLNRSAGVGRFWDGEFNPGTRLTKTLFASTDYRHIDAAQDWELKLERLG